MTRSIAVGISLRCLPEQGAVGAEHQRRAVQGAAVPLDHADDEVDGVVPGHRADGLGGRSGHVDGALEQAAELVTPLGGPHADADAEIVALGIPGDVRLGEDDEFGPLLGRIRREVGELLERPGGVEQDGGRLHDGHPHRPGAYDHRIGWVTRHRSSSERGSLPSRRTGLRFICRRVAPRGRAPDATGTMPQSRQQRSPGVSLMHGAGSPARRAGPSGRWHRTGGDGRPGR